MEIKVNLEEIFAAASEEGESWQDVIRNDVVQYVAQQIVPETKRVMKDSIAKAVDEAVTTVIKEQMPTVLTNLMHLEYTPVDQYGRKSEPTNLRQALLDEMKKQMVYKRVAYESDKNVFTKAVDALVESEVAKFKTEFHSQVTKDFVAQSTKFAVDELRKKFGLPAV